MASLALVLVLWGQGGLISESFANDWQSKLVQAEGNQVPLDAEVVARLEQLRAAAEKGKASAQFMWGMLHFQGELVERDEALGVEWFRKAAKQEHLEAVNALGVAYRDGRGVKQDDDKAASYFEEAAEQGLPLAQYYYGWMAERGRGVKKSEREAALWYRRAAWQKEPLAQTALGFCYLDGRGVGKNPKKAFEWLEKAALQGVPVAQTHVGQLYYVGRGVDQDFRRAGMWYQRAAKQGDAWGLNNIAWMLATCPDDEFWDGDSAVIFAKEAVRVTEGSRFEIMDTLAAAYARAGDFVLAVDTQRRAMKTMKERRKENGALFEGTKEEREEWEVRMDELRDEFGKRLAMYEREEAYVEWEIPDLDTPSKSPSEEEEEGPSKEDRTPATGGDVVAEVV